MVAPNDSNRVCRPSHEPRFVMKLFAVFQSGEGLWGQQTDSVCRQTPEAAAQEQPTCTHVYSRSVSQSIHLRSVSPSAAFGKI